MRSTTLYLGKGAEKEWHGEKRKPDIKNIRYHYFLDRITFVGQAVNDVDALYERRRIKSGFAVCRTYFPGGRKNRFFG